MLRDAELPARRYLRLILNNIHGENDVGVVQDLMGQSSSAITIYGDPANVKEARQTLAEYALKALDDAAPGNDFQLAWAHCFIGAARSEEHLAVLSGVLEGIKIFQGLKVDTDLRWSIVSALAGVGTGKPALVDAELERDPTDEGQRWAAMARAATPTAEAKAAAWAALTEDTSLPLATMRSIMAGFHRFDQRALLEPYRGKYFSTLADIWKTRDIEIGLAFARMMYPAVLIGEETVAETDRNLNGGEPLPGPVRRILLEGKDNMLRAMRGRAVDAAATEKVPAQR
jgi:aminopeptidase N